MKKLICSILSVILLCSSLCVSAADFKDMPDNWSTQALTKAVENGLLTGYEDNTIRPSDNLTRAQMATIMVRAFGSTREDDISEFADVKQGEWYYSYLAAAVAKGIFKGDGANLNPNNYITRQEAFTVIARAFELREGKKSDLSSFKDADKVADWAAGYVAAVVNGGYAKGSDGYLNPLSNITRAEFAVLMDNIVKQYITEPGTYTASDIAEGNILIRASNVTIENAEIKGSIILGDSVKNGGVTLSSTTVKGIIVNDKDNVKIVTKGSSAIDDDYKFYGGSGNKNDNNDNNGGNGNEGDIGSGDDGSGETDPDGGIEDGGEL